MPLKRGSGAASRSTNIREMMHSWERTGRIGRIRPKNKRQATRIAIAAAYSQSRRSRRR